MTTTITHAEGILTPLAVEGYKAARPANTVIHDILNRVEPDVTLRAFGMRTGTLTLAFVGDAPAFAALTALVVPQTLTLANSTIPGLGMAFVIAGGEIEIEQDDTDVSLWRIVVPFQEVTA